MVTEQAEKEQCETSPGDTHDNVDQEAAEAEPQAVEETGGQDAEQEPQEEEPSSGRGAEQTETAADDGQVQQDSAPQETVCH